MAGSIWALESPTDPFWILMLLPLLLYGASRVILPSTWRAVITLPRITVGLASLVNVALLVAVVVTTYHAKAGRLAAQEDFGTFMMILLLGSACVMICVLAGLFSMVAKYRSGVLNSGVIRTPTFLLGLANCVAPPTLAVALLWLVKR
jgi:hypothetical protein